MYRRRRSGRSSFLSPPLSLSLSSLVSVLPLLSARAIVYPPYAETQYRESARFFGSLASSLARRRGRERTRPRYSRKPKLITEQVHVLPSVAAAATADVQSFTPGLGLALASGRETGSRSLVGLCLLLARVYV